MMARMDEMTAWLRAQVETDKAAALAVRDNSAPWDGQWQARGRHALETYNGWVLAIAGIRAGNGGVALPAIGSESGKAMLNFAPGVR